MDRFNKVVPKIQLNIEACKAKACDSSLEEDDWLYLKEIAEDLENILSDLKRFKEDIQKNVR